MSHRIYALVCAAGAFALASVLLAPAARASGAREHDGFFLRVGLGGGSLTLDRSVEASRVGVTGSEVDGDSTIAGPVGAFELTLGGTPARGLVVGGTFLSYSLAQPVVEHEAGGETELEDPLSAGLLGATVLWYPDPRGGFSVGGTLGWAWAIARAPDGSLFEYLGGTGGGLSLHVGYELWIASEWSLGGALRLTGASLSGAGEESGVRAEESDALRTLGLYLTATLH
ncbi:MAG: hypothetical protein IT376_00650 [Polyangiaceae bacterium]|nr:hypothetical protein [Polyangiaceae bacterium]